MTHQDYMRLAIQESQLAVDQGQAPFAVVVVDEQGNVIHKDHDRVLELMTPIAHGEVNAINYLCNKLNTLKLTNLTFYTTSEPCPTCLTSMIKAQVPTCYYGAKTETTASLPIPCEELAKRATKYQMKITGGILEEECTQQRTNLLAQMKI